MKIRIFLSASMLLFGILAFVGSVKAQGAAVPTSKNIAIIEVSVTGIEAEGALTTLALMVDTDRLVSASGEELAKIPGNSLELMQERFLRLKECLGVVSCTIDKATGNVSIEVAAGQTLADVKGQIQLVAQGKSCN